MTIQQALERAKRLAQERAQVAPAEAKRALTVPTIPFESQASGSVDTAVDLSRKASRAPSVHPRPPLDLPRLRYDESRCAEHRILVPEVEAAYASAVAPYRMLRTRILQVCRTNAWSTVGLTSAGPGEGKSVTVLNLALSLAREGNHDVFLLDLDMRNPSTCRYLGVKPQAEIQQYFAGQVSEKDILFSIGVERLAIAGSLAGVANASELLATNRFESLVEFIKNHSTNPFIILDLPPLLATDEALVLAPRIDSIVLVVSESQTRRDGVSRSLGMLADFPLAGVVMNQSSESLGADYYGSYY